MEAPETNGQNTHDTVEAALATIRRGGVIIVVDAKDRENEGDFVCAAETITPEIVDFMLTHGRGKLCVPLVQEAADRLELRPIVEGTRNTALHRTHFLTPVDHVDSGTGVSPDSRAMTIRALSELNTTAADLVRPGHVDTLLAKEGGVLRRAGHTEATIDLMRLAGLKPTGVLIEICSANGHDMATFSELEEIAEKLDIPILGIDELIRYRRVRERLVERAAAVKIPTKHFGEPTVIGYRVEHETQEPLAIVWGDLASAEAPLVRMHSSCFTGDLLDSLRCDCGDQLHMAMDQIHREGTGAVVYLPQEGRGIGLMAKLQAYELQDQGYDTVEANEKLGFKADMRDYMVGMQILKDLGLTKIRLLTNNKKKTDAPMLAGMDLQIVEQIPIIAPPNENRRQYLATKRDKLGHLLPADE